MIADDIEPITAEDFSDVSVSHMSQLLQAISIEEEDFPSVGAFLSRLRCPQLVASALLTKEPSQSRRSMKVVCNSNLVSVGFWDAPTAIRPHIQAFLCVEEDHSAAAIAVEFLLDSICKESLSGTPVQVNLRLLPGHITTRRVTIAYGFRSSSEKRCGTPENSIGSSGDAQSWATVSRTTANRGMFSSACPRAMPSFRFIYAHQLRLEAQQGKQ